MHAESISMHLMPLLHRLPGEGIAQRWLEAWRWRRSCCFWSARTCVWHETCMEPDW